MHTVPISEKEGHGFKGQLGGVYHKVWGEENEGRDVVIIL